MDCVNEKEENSWDSFTIKTMEIDSIYEELKQVEQLRRNAQMALNHVKKKPMKNSCLGIIEVDIIFNGEEKTEIFFTRSGPFSIPYDDSHAVSLLIRNAAQPAFNPRKMSNFNSTAFTRHYEKDICRKSSNELLFEEAAKRMKNIFENFKNRVEEGKRELAIQEVHDRFEPHLMAFLGKDEVQSELRRIIKAFDNGIEKLKKDPKFPYYTSKMFFVNDDDASFSFDIILDVIEKNEELDKHYEPWTQLFWEILIHREVRKAFNEDKLRLATFSDISLKQFLDAHKKAIQDEMENFQSQLKKEIGEKVEEYSLQGRIQMLNAYIDGAIPMALMLSLLQCSEDNGLYEINKFLEEHVNDDFQIKKVKWLPLEYHDKDKMWIHKSLCSLCGSDDEFGFKKRLSYILSDFQQKTKSNKDISSMKTIDRSQSNTTGETAKNSHMDEANASSSSLSMVESFQEKENSIYTFQDADQCREKVFEVMYKLEQIKETPSRFVVKYGSFATLKSRECQCLYTPNIDMKKKEYDNQMVWWIEFRDKNDIPSKLMAAKKLEFDMEQLIPSNNHKYHS